MEVSYSNNGSGLRYSCIEGNLRYGHARCQSLLGRPLEKALEALVLEALEPAALELSVRAVEKLQQEQERSHQDWLQRLERARYNVELARRRYEKVDPDYRLAAETLEKEWNEALRAQRTFELDYELFCRKQPLELSEQQRQSITALAMDIPSLWHAPSTLPEQRQALVRLLVERVEVFIEGDSEKVQLLIHWAGGDQSQLELERPVAKLEQLSFYPRMLAQLQQLLEAGMNDEQIAEQLGALGYHSASGAALSGSTIGTLRRLMGWRRGAMGAGS